MDIKSFLKLVEIQTKVASVIPYLLGTFYVLYRYENFNLKNAIIMFLSMIIFDMTTTVINNYIDYAKAIKKEGYGYETHNAIVSHNLNPKVVRTLICTMLVVAVTLGLILVKNTNIIVLLIGAISFVIGITYSFGPIPISRTPFGEIFSGLAMGFIITFLSIYIHIFDAGILSVNINELSNINISFNFIELIKIFIICLSPIMGISNIMLANNICDIDEDIENKRYTLPIYIGKENALRVFKWLYYIGFISIFIGILIRALPVVSIVTLLVLKVVQGNINKFNKLQTKKDTFILAVKNFVITNLVYVITILCGLILDLY
ncbi:MULTISPECIES: 1,4-dihydroxy-2-naphthoate polyprenyltransferase [unclassified Clostridium]|jgi:ubiA prenyltransferase|uniref:1,4-dihydroxy-2-naphthoate polyprenyltransferase n=1 Tax=unclassified Clostridium TaxID=2614128 RepID=UPI0025C6D320|nr:1,4-dihydroxy-2-naphthoate polyprenyltransferase [Clostridium sp.]MCI6692284.1 1,4-dihydroxy-2-naphthoate polyprenyltransferase [Clostridium sp.]MDY2630681.1 1,4-dihydroxy-2-naphthoate polyprenyltransferase [Clostridium sp.]MDY4252722.1 1,4-dihydroxy-2-naphthoate polyprenyltransferase [Clostridium sp.]